MILSFHPIFEGDKQIIVAGRAPGKKELNAIRAADAVILPQGCKQPLYQMATDTCPRVFPNYDARFAFPGKLMQIELFRKTGTPHPRTRLFSDMDDYWERSSSGDLAQWEFPFVFKFAWGGEGDAVFPVTAPNQLDRLLDLARKAERPGQKGFLFQEYISSGNKTLRVVVIHDRILSYWRRNRGGFYSNLSKGAFIDRDFDPGLQKVGQKAVTAFCGKTRINLAGFDLIFSLNPADENSLFLEINYFFGRKGLGGSQPYYVLLTAQIIRWIHDMGLTYCPKKKPGGVEDD
jgi:ribosomal protein S6--L-glutamate ligase